MQYVMALFPNLLFEFWDVFFTVEGMVITYTMEYLSLDTTFIISISILKC